MDSKILKNGYVNGLLRMFAYAWLIIIGMYLVIELTQALE